MWSKYKDKSFILNLEIKFFNYLVCGLFFTAAAKQLSLTNRSKKLIESFSDALEAGIQSVESYARARSGDKTLLDALIPAFDYLKLKRTQECFTSLDWENLALVTEQAAQETQNLTAKVGRAAYKKSIENTAVDPGAYAVALIFRAISDPFIKVSRQ